MLTDPNCSGALGNVCRLCSCTVPTTATVVVWYVTNTGLMCLTCCNFGVNMPTDQHCSGKLANYCRLCNGTLANYCNSYGLARDRKRGIHVLNPGVNMPTDPTAAARLPTAACCAVALSPTTATAVVSHVTKQRCACSEPRCQHAYRPNCSGTLANCCMLCSGTLANNCDSCGLACDKTEGCKLLTGTDTTPANWHMCSVLPVLRCCATTRRRSF
jgi:hypothetical protein